MADSICVLDNCRAWHGKLFRWADHLVRLRRDCAACFLPLTESDAELTARAERLVAGQDLHVITVVSPAGTTMSTRSVDRDREKHFDRDGVTLKVVGYQPVGKNALLSPRVKHGNRLHWHIAHHLAGAAMPVLLDRPNGTLTETPIACVLAVIDGSLITPPRELILDSIGLRVTLELADASGMPCREAEIPEADWRQASEMMLTGSGIGVAAVSRINDHPVPWPGPIYQRLKAAWDGILRR